MRCDLLSEFKWFDDYRKIENEIAVLELDLSRTKRELSRWENPSDLGKLKIDPESRAAKVEDVIEAIEYDIAHKMNDLYDIQQLVSTFDGLEHKILIKKYIEGKTLEVAAEELGYATQYIYNKHALIKKMLKYASSLT